MDGSLVSLTAHIRPQLSELPETDRRKAILVVGASRSGTSLIAHLLHKLGAETGADLLGAGYGNPLGHWEPRTLVALNDEALSAMGLSWEDPRARPRGWFQSREAHKLTLKLVEHINELFGTGQLFVIKDPRLTRILPLYLSALDILDIEPVVVLQSRHPEEAAASLVARDGFTTAVAELLWLRCVAEAEFDSRQCKRTWVLFDELANDLEHTLVRLTAELQISWPTSLEERLMDLRRIIKPRFVHQRRTNSESGQKPLVSDLWAGIQAAARADDTHAQHIFNAVWQSLDELDYWGTAFSNVGEKCGFEAGRQAVFQTRSWKLSAPFRALAERLLNQKRSSAAGQ
jgi:hypothetical protein